MEGIKIKKLIIVGAGGHGKCCLDIAREMKIYDEIVFLDDHHLNESINDCKVIGSIDEMSSYYPEYTSIFIAIGNNQIRSRLLLQAKEIGYELPILQHPTSIVSKYATIKEGTVIFPNTVIENNANISNGCIITANTTINHDAYIEDYVLIYSNTVIRPNTLIGAYTRIGSNCTITFGTKIKACSDIDDGVVVKENQEYSFEMGV